MSDAPELSVLNPSRNEVDFAVSGLSGSPKRGARLFELWRYLQAGIVNTAFGFGLYALLVRVGLDRYVAQALGHAFGVAFNYWTYSRHVFRGATPAKARFVASYAANYLASAAALALASLAFASPYLAGAVATAIVAAGNYFALRHLVFRTLRTA